jgi:hypothetical protein
MAAINPRATKAPFPWFGGKSRVADDIWQRLGRPAQYIEPFCGRLTYGGKSTTDAECIWFSPACLGSRQMGMFAP